MEEHLCQWFCHLYSLECKTVLEAILHIYMLLFMVEGLKFNLNPNIPENAFEAVLDYNGCLEAILYVNMLLRMVEDPKLVFNSNYT